MDNVHGASMVDSAVNDASAQVSDEPPADFVAHLAQELGLERDAAQATLCEWLHHYEPEHASS